MLRSELRGESYVKSDVVRNLQPLIPNRSSASIERKFQNISAVLDEEGFDWIDGYKPLAHYQHELRDAVLASVGQGHRIGEAMAAFEQAAIRPRLPRQSGHGRCRRPWFRDQLANRRRRTSVRLTGSP